MFVENESVQQPLETFKIILMKYQNNQYPEDCMHHLKNYRIEDITRQLMDRKHSLCL